MSIRVANETVASRLKLWADFAIVIDFAVEYYCHGLIGSPHRLVTTGREVDN